MIAQGPIPEQPTGTTVETVDIPVQSTAVQSAAGSEFSNSDVQMSSDIKCKRTTVTRKRYTGPVMMYKLVNWTEWCYDGTHIAEASLCSIKLGKLVSP